MIKEDQIKQESKIQKKCEYCGKPLEKKSFFISSFYTTPSEVCNKCYAELITDTSFMQRNH